MKTTMGKSREELLLDWSRTGFADLDREQLKQAAEMLGVDYAPQTNNDTLRKKLREAIGTVDGMLPPEDVRAIRDEVPANRNLSLATPPPNLSPSGRWGGRYRRVRLVKTDFYKKFVAFPISWEGQQRYFHFDTDIDMPWPYYQALKSMVETHISQSLAPDGKSTVRTETHTPGLPFSDLGDVPGTEDLPTSMVEYVQWLAKANKNFADTPRRDLIRVMRWLHGPAVNAQLKDLSDDDVRDKLLTFLGFDIYEEAA
jgi:hypothetical protein